MARYRNTIVKNKPEYVHRKLLLTDGSRNRLFQDDGKYIQIEVDAQGEMIANEIVFTQEPKNLQQKRFESSLRSIGENYLGLKDPSVTQMLRYFVLPEMEVERIFNNLRYKYLRAIYLSGFANPSRLISAEFNQAFQALAGIKVYQGRTQSRRENDDFWRSACFKENAKQDIDWKEDRQALDFVLTLIRSEKNDNVSDTYKELIAIKPGFHEIWLHDDFFAGVPEGSSPRDKVFKMLRGYDEALDLARMPNEINRNNYRSYAACNVTEGPFVFRRSISVSYFDEIRKISSRDELNALDAKFHILDYRNCAIDSRKMLEEFLQKAERFRGFL